MVKTASDFSLIKTDISFINPQNKICGTDFKLYEAIKIPFDTSEFIQCILVNKDTDEVIPAVYFISGRSSLSIFERINPCGILFLFTSDVKNSNHIQYDVFYR
jgi:hypothetical protein